MLRRKMFRDLKENKGAYAACLVVIIIGLMVFTLFSTVVDNLKLSQNYFYRAQNFADGFAEIKSMPESQVKRLKNIDGIKEIEGRLIKDVRVLPPGRDENIFLRLISIYPDQENPINGVELISGIPLDNKELNIWIDNKFFEANNLELGRELNIIAEGKKRSLRIAGVGRSPEFIYALRTSSDMYPSPETFGIVFLPFNVMKELFSEHDAVNSLVFTLKPGAAYEDVEERLKPELERYGLKSIYHRKDQTSHLLLTQEIQGLEGAASALPVLFLSIAGIIMYIMLKRMTEQQRGQIGVLKAFGYTHREIILHYISYSFVTGITGGIVGGFLGVVLSYPFSSIFREFFNMPGLAGKVSPKYFISGIMLSFIFSIFAGYMGCRRILILQPAEAMRPPAPPAGRKTWLENIAFFWNVLTVQGKMAVRNVFRNKSRSIFVFLGVMFSFSILGLTWSMNDLIQKILFDQYEKVETYDVKVSLRNFSVQKKAIRELDRFLGVKKVEALAEIPVTLKNKWMEKDVVLLGVHEDSSLYNILNKNNDKVNPPKNGILISERLSELLGAEVGTQLNVESLLLKNTADDKQLQVAGVIPQYIGLSAYMELNALQEFIGQKELITSLMLEMDEGSIPLLQEKYSPSEVVTGIDDRMERLEKTKEMMASYFGVIYIYALIAMVISFAIIYNSSIITLSERSHELATMMVLGMTPAEVRSVITFENWFIGFFAMIAGIPASKTLLVGMSRSFSTDMYTMPTEITYSALILAALTTAGSIWIAQYAAGRKIGGLSLASTLKIRE